MALDLDIEHRGPPAAHRQARCRNEMTKAPKIDRVSLDLDGASNEHRLDMWADIVRPFFDVSLLNKEAEAPIERADVWLLDNVALTRVAFGSQVFDRNRTHLGFDVADCLLVQLYLSGELHGEMEGQSFQIKPGDLHILDFSRPYAAQASKAHLVSFLVSHDLVGYDKGRHPATLTVPRDDAVGRILRGTVLSVFDQVDAITKADQAAIAGGLVGLLRGAFFSSNSEVVAPAFTAARGRAMRDYIAQNLRSDKLTADAICSEFGLSRATLYREFEADGGLKRYITTRRLNAALKSLTFTDTPRGAIGRAAETWGFSSTSHFCREFRKQFGFGPGSVLGTRSRAEVAKAEQPDAVPMSSDLMPLLKKL